MTYFLGLSLNYNEYYISFSKGSIYFQNGFRNKKDVLLYKDSFIKVHDYNVGVIAKYAIDIRLVAS